MGDAGTVWMHPAEGARPVVVATLMRAEGGTGVQSHVATVRHHLSGAGRDVTVISPFDNPSMLLRPAFAARLLTRPLSRAAAVWWYRRGHAAFLAAPLRAAIAERPEAVIYAQCPVSAEVALRVRRPGQRVVLVVHFNISQADEWADKGEIPRHGRLFRSIRSLEDRVIPGLDGIVYVSDFARRVVEERIPAAAVVPHVVVPNPVAVPDGPTVRGDGPRALVTIGALEPRKNQAYLLDVLHVLAERGLRPGLTLIGDGPDRRSLERRAVELGVDDQVRFLGYVREPASELAAHRVYCHAAQMEAFGIVIAEAMACGLPVVAGGVGGVPEVMEPGITGRLWPLDDAGRAADVLAGVLEQAPGPMGAAGWERARDRYLASRVCEQLDSFLQHTVMPGGGTARVDRPTKEMR